MGKRFLAIGVAVATGSGLLTATPADASYAVVSITFPDGNSEFYSPFAGPATVTFTFDGSENDATFELRLRPLGGTAIRTKQVLIDPDTQSSPRSVSFSWPALSVASAKTYQVAVYRNGVPQVAAESFLLKPPLVSILGAAPDPFFPKIDDGYKDTTRVRFALAADAGAEARVYQPRSTGKCCGALVRHESLGNLLAGERAWVWDGRDDNGGDLAKGDYFVRIWADDGIVAPALSKAMKVAIARTYRAKATKEKPARMFHHTGPSYPIVLGGGCLVYESVGNLIFLCQGGTMTVYWRWGLAANERIVGQSFVVDNPTNGCPRSIRTTGHTKHQSWFRMYENLVGAAGLCSLSTAKITYTYPKAS